MDMNLNAHHSCHRAALFDLDGVVFDTEPQYSLFWSRIGMVYHPELPHFEQLIKGQTLTQIFEAHFADMPSVQKDIRQQLDLFESRMQFVYVPGFERFLQALKERGVFTAVVTSSNDAKMQSVYAAHPGFKEQFDKVFTAEHFTRSKPHPECYQVAARYFDVPCEECVVFEDSFNGLRSAQAARTCVVGLATTNEAADIAPFCNEVIKDYLCFDSEKIMQLMGETKLK